MAKRLPAARKVERDAEIVADRARGLSWAIIAKRHNLTERQCGSIWTTERTMSVAPDPDPLTTLDEALLRYDAVIEQLAVIAECATQDAVRLGALKTQL